MGIIVTRGCFLLRRFCFSATFWSRVLKSYGEPAPFVPAFRAFVCSQLGKYLPGKAMVVVIRTGMARGFGVTAGPAVAGTFVETLMWIFVGAQIASVFCSARQANPMVCVGWR
ncbi:MAG: hypothetical protein R3C03_00675 [Pirellulaceae bacterium]